MQKARSALEQVQSLLGNNRGRGSSDGAKLRAISEGSMVIRSSSAKAWCETARPLSERGARMAAVRMAAATRAARLDTALLHFRRYDLDRSRPSGREVRGLAQKAGLRIAAPGEAIRAATVVLTYQPLPDQAMDRFPVVDHEQLVVVVNQMAEHGGRSDSERKEN